MLLYVDVCIHVLWIALFMVYNISNFYVPRFWRIKTPFPHPKSWCCQHRLHCCCEWNKPDMLPKTGHVSLCRYHTYTCYSNFIPYCLNLYYLFVVNITARKTILRNNNSKIPHVHAPPSVHTAQIIPYDMSPVMQ